MRPLILAAPAALLLALAAGIVAGATLIPNAKPIAQIADGGE